MLCDILFHRHDIFLLFFAPRLVDLIDKFTLIGKKEEAFRVLIESSDRVNALGIMDILYDIFPSVLLSCRANHSTRLVIGKKNLSRLFPLLSLSGNVLPVQFYLFLTADFLTKARELSVYFYFPLRNQAVSLSSRANAHCREPFIDSHSFLRLYLYVLCIFSYNAPNDSIEERQFSIMRRGKTHFNHPCRKGEKKK